MTSRVLQVEVRTVPSTAFDGQKPGTSGLRKKVKVFAQPHYLENFVQAVFDVVPDRGLLVIGGDGRYHNDVAIQTILRMAVANGFEHLMIGEGGILSTPAVSHLVRKFGAMGALILSASHNPAGPNEDFGIKFNNASGAPAPESITSAIYQRTRQIDHYRIADVPELALTKGASVEVDIGAPLKTRIDVVSSVEDYVALMKTLFDFDALRAGFADGRLSLCFDAMHAVTGPYAKAVFEAVLGAAPGSLMNAVPEPDFGGGHPDPNLVHAQDLIQRMARKDAPILGAASDGDGDRNLVLGKECFISPSDSLATIAHHATQIPQFSHGLSGVARSMPTSTALDRVALRLGIPCYETPTGWKYFGNLLDAGKINLCGEESFGTSGDHVREKDGIWAVLCWLTLILKTGKTPQQLLVDLWQTDGRSYYCRHDFEGIPTEKADALMAQLTESVQHGDVGSVVPFELANADVFCYTDPIDHSVSDHQGVRVVMRCGSRILFRLSGTGTDSATLRVYLEKVEPAQSSALLEDTLTITEPLRKLAMRIADIEKFTGMTRATVVT